MHCFTGCGTIRAFARRRKITPFKVREKFPEFMDVFGGLGSAKLLDDLERFVCCMYGKAQNSSVNKRRHVSFSQKYQGTSRQVLSSLYLPRCAVASEIFVPSVLYFPSVLPGNWLTA